MASLPSFSSLTVSAIYDHYENTVTNFRRPHLGASRIGIPCFRALWYEFRWCLDPEFPGRILRLFETGHREEIRLLKNLKDIGISVQADIAGKQISFKKFGGHFGGSVDGIGTGFLEAPKAQHIIEVKTSNVKSFKDMQKRGIQLSKPVHYAQVCMYMHALSITRAFYFMICKDTDEIYQERVYENTEYATMLTEKAKQIIFTDTPPEKLENYECRWCPYHDLCSGKKLPLVSCRTCANATPELVGGWSCKHAIIMDLTEQQRGCENHIYIPALVPRMVTDANAIGGWIEYEGGIINGPGYTSSEEMRERWLE